MASHGARAQHQVESDSSTRNRESAAFGAAFPVVPGHALLGAQCTATSMIGGGFILEDPIFNGLAVSLIFGILVSTVLTLLVIPVLYYAYLRRTEARGFC